MKTQTELYEIYKTLPDYGATNWENLEHIKFDLADNELRVYPKSSLAEKWIGKGEYLGFNVENYL